MKLLLKFQTKEVYLVKANFFFKEIVIDLITADDRAIYVCLLLGKRGGWSEAVMCSKNRLPCLQTHVKIREKGIFQVFGLRN